METDDVVAEGLKRQRDSMFLVLSCIYSRERQAIPTGGTKAVSMPGCRPCTSGDEKRRECLERGGTVAFMDGSPQRT